MGHFRGSLQGNRGEASRLGTAKTGLQAHIASWQGAVDVDLYVKDGVDYATVSLTTHHGKGCHRTLYDGPVSGEVIPSKDDATRIHNALVAFEASHAR